MPPRKHLQDARFWVRISTGLLVPCGIISYHGRQSFTPSVLSGYTPPHDIKAKHLREEIQEHTRIFPPTKYPPFTQYIPRRVDNKWATKYDKAKNMWRWWNRLSCWPFAVSSAGYLMAGGHLVLWRRQAMQSSPIGLRVMLCVLGFSGMGLAYITEETYRAGLVKELYERVKKEDEEGQKPAEDSLDDMTDVWVDPYSGGTQWSKSSDEREQYKS